MAAESSAPRRNHPVYLALIALGILAAAVAASTIGFITYEYVTREELRNPPEQEEHTSPPSHFLVS